MWLLYASKAQGLAGSKHDFQHRLGEALVQAARAGQREFVETLLRSTLLTARRQGYYDMAIETALIAGHGSIALALLNQRSGPRDNEFMRDVLRSAIAAGETSFIDHLPRECPRAYGNALILGLEDASRLGRASTAALLLSWVTAAELAANPNALYWDGRRGHAGILHMLWQHLPRDELLPLLGALADAVYWPSGETSMQVLHAI
jgi:hypothetical protein